MPAACRLFSQDSIMLMLRQTALVWAALACPHETHKVTMGQLPRTRNLQKKVGLIAKYQTDRCCVFCLTLPAGQSLGVVPTVSSPTVLSSRQTSMSLLLQMLREAATDPKRCTSP